MLTVEDILAALVGRSQWLETTNRDKSTKRFRKYAGIMGELEQTLAELKHEHVPRGTPPAPTAAGTATRNKSRGGSMSSLAAEMVVGMSRNEWASVLWIIDSEKAAFDLLHASLMSKARQSVVRDRFWPKNIRRKNCDCGRAPAIDYLPDLVHLALLELRAPGLFDSHRARADWFGLSPQHWRKIAERPYSVLQGQTFVWFGGSCTHIARRLNMARRALDPA